MTPRCRCASLSRATALYAPRSLKLPMGCRLSGFRYATASVTDDRRTSGVCRTAPRRRSRASANCAAVTSSVAASTFVAVTSDLQNDWHDEGPPCRLLLDVALQVDADLLLDQYLIGTLLGAGFLECLADDGLCLLAQFQIAGDKTARHKLRHAFHAAGELVDGDDGDHQAVLTEMTAVANDHVLDHVAGSAGVEQH